MHYTLWINLVFPLPVTKEYLWKVLTTASDSQHPQLQCGLNCIWTIGQEVECVALDTDGNPTPRIRRELLYCSPNECMRIKIFHENLGNKYYSEVHYKITPTTQGVLLNIKQGDFSHFPAAEKMFKACLKEWENSQDDLIKTCLIRAHT